MKRLSCVKISAAVCCFFLLCGCSKDAVCERSLFAMDTYMTFKISGSEEALDDVCAEITRLEKLLSCEDGESEIFALNNAEGVPVSVSDETMEIINRSVSINEETNGAFDITLYPLSKEWGFPTGEYKVPEQGRIDGLLAKTGSGKIAVDEQGGTVTLDEGTMLDLGAIAKGYAGDNAADVLRNAGVESALLNLGGNVRTVGARPNGSPWSIGIQDPESGGLLVGSVSVFDKAVVTSGGYERYFELGGKTYSHIIDPKTGRPCESDVISATVIGSDGTLCDALSTAFFVMGSQKAEEYLSNHTDVGAVIVTNAHKIMITSDIEDDFTASDNYEDAEISVIE